MTFSEVRQLSGDNKPHNHHASLTEVKHKMQQETNLSLCFTGSPAQQQQKLE